MYPKITVIVPIYNSERYLSRCIESVLSQSYDDWQMILVDDGSTDNSLDICQTYAQQDSRIIVIHQQNSGAGAARNVGLSKSIGEYIVFIDSDDFVDKDYFNFLSKHDEDVVFIDVEAVSELGTVTRKEYMSCYSGMSKEDFMRSQMTGKINWGGVRKVVKRSIIQQYNIFYSNHKVGEEALFTYCSVFHSKSIGFIHHPVYFYVQRQDSLSHTQMDNPWGNVALALKDETLNNGSYHMYADTINAFILTASAISSDRLATNYSYGIYKNKVNKLYDVLLDTIDKSYSIDYKHMSMKALILGKLLLCRCFNLIWVLSKFKQTIKI